MATDLKKAALVKITQDEACAVIGGVDKGAQDALYTIGYVIGVIVRFVINIFKKMGAK